VPRTPKFPRYPAKCHSSGQARLVIQGRTHYLGVFGSPRSHDEYRRLLAQWQVARGDAGAVPPVRPGECATVEACVALAWEDAQARFRRPDGSTSRELFSTWYALRPLQVHFGSVPVREFGTGVLKAYRRLLLAGYDDPERGRQKPSCRQVVNRHVVRVRTCVRRLELDGKVPEGTWGRLRALGPLSRGEDGCREGRKVRPPDVLDLLAAWCFLPPGPRALVLVHLHTGARPSELLGLRASDLTRPRRGAVWRADLEHHKTAHQGKSRSLFLGPRSQAALSAVLAGAAPGDYLFSPRRSETLRSASRRARRRTKVQPSQVRRRGAASRAGDRYSVLGYRQALARACARAGVPPVTPYAIRHLAATRIAAHPEGGDDLARIVLGHSLPGVTGNYVADDLRRAEAWMAKYG
jgi:integrase